MRFRVQMRTDGAASAVAGAEKWTVTFTEVNLRQRINATEQLPKTMLPMAEFRNLEDPLMWAQVERALKQPFAVLLRSREQKVAKVLFNEAEPFWSVNIKKGFLSMLQVDFVPKIPSAQMENGQWTKEQDEMTTAAVCRTFYTADQIEYTSPTRQSTVSPSPSTSTTAATPWTAAAAWPPCGTACGTTRASGQLARRAAAPT
ncbi:hypothetical protein BOX15_Mlig008746g3 [Macrostomum lignano]|uniref:Vitellogenin domain-containing protein n=1 Tax=Macrostomum lignano TaxID=282301 RepID=A0A267GR18_9PLAT|nr:hypothetical protein BOX15_Mlig008746g3 [Macrostomum lignano]